MWGTVHQVMHRLAQGNRVLYVEEPVTMLAPLKVPNHWRRWQHVLPRLRNPEPGLWVLTPPPLLPFANMKPAINRANQAVLAGYIRWALRRLEFGDRPILWTYLPSSVHLVDHFPPTKGDTPGLVLYHCVDEHSAFPGLVSPEVVRAYDDGLTRRADLVIATADSLAYPRRFLNSHTYTVLNAADVELFSLSLDPELPIPLELAAIPAPRLVIVGALDYRVDLQALEILAQADVSWQIVLIGPVKSGQLEEMRLRRPANVHFLGEKPHPELPGYLKGASVALIPYVRSTLTKAIFPLKLFEYLAAGVPVVVGGLPELRRFGDLIGVAETVDDYPSLVRRALAEDTPEKRSVRTAFAALNTWDGRVEDISRLVQEALGRLPSLLPLRQTPTQGS
jgi:glycosyltransferase involved in cell wall biosynthesis